jgi:hypothetical protein
VHHVLGPRETRTATAVLSRVCNSFFAGTRVTTWNYDGYRGFLTNKVYDGGSAGPGYAYTPAGRLQTRAWARGITTTNSYNNNGDLQ